MDTIEATLAFAALSQPSRLDAFRLLVRHEPDGLPAGEVARAMAVPQNTMSVHLAVLARAGLVTADRQGRSVIYRAVIDRVREIASFLVSECCGGHPELCAPLVAEFARCRCAEEAEHA